jgi:hypothetical protein
MALLNITRSPFTLFAHSICIILLVSIHISFSPTTMISSGYLWTNAVTHIEYFNTFIATFFLTTSKGDNHNNKQNILFHTNNFSKDI